MFERFSEQGRWVLVLAQDEARALKHNYIGTEHILLGLLREQGVAARVLEALDVTIEPVRAQVFHIVGQGDEHMSGQIPFTPRAKKILDLATREADSLGSKYVDDEHLLLALVRENEGVAARILLDFVADVTDLYHELRTALTEASGRPLGEEEPESQLATQPESLALSEELVATLSALREDKEAALEQQLWQRASELMGRQRRLEAAAGTLERTYAAELKLRAQEAAETVDAGLGFKVATLSPADLEGRLRELGEEGWELVSVTLVGESALAFLHRVVE